MTGRHVVKQLLERDHNVRVIVRSPEKLSDAVVNHPNIEIVRAELLELSDDEMVRHVKGCDAVVSCLGHTLDFKGMFGEPKQLCLQAVKRLCAAIESVGAGIPKKFILMNTVGVANPELVESRAWFERSLLFLLRYTLPPHRDNEMASEFLFSGVGKKNAYIEWCSVRPDSLINDEVSVYDIVASPTTGIFTGRATTRANVAHFMVELILDDDLWNCWKFRMPVIMDALKRS